MTGPRGNPWRFDGTTSTGSYFAIGCALSTVKLALDHLVATRAFGRPWSPLGYAITGEIGGLLSLDRDDQAFFATMLALALPFLAAGLVLTVRRLRDAGWPLWLAACFFASMPINLVFFLVLSLTPTRLVAEHGTLGDVLDGSATAGAKPIGARHRMSSPRGWCPA